MQAKVKVFIFTADHIIEKEISDWLQQEDVIIITSNTIVVKDMISHVVYYMNSVSIFDKQILGD